MFNALKLKMHMIIHLQKISFINTILVIKDLTN